MKKPFDMAWRNEAVRLYLIHKDVKYVSEALNRDLGWVRKHLVKVGIYEYKNNGKWLNNSHKGEKRAVHRAWEITEDVPNRNCSKCKGSFKPRSRYVFRCDSCKSVSNGWVNTAYDLPFNLKR